MWHSVLGISKFQISTKKLKIIWAPQNPSMDEGWSRLTVQRHNYRFHLQKELCSCKKAEVKASSDDDNARNFDSRPPGVCRCVVFHMSGYVLWSNSHAYLLPTVGLSLTSIGAHFNDADDSLPSNPLMYAGDGRIIVDSVTSHASKMSTTSWLMYCFMRCAQLHYCRR